MECDPFPDHSLHIALNTASGSGITSHVRRQNPATELNVASFADIRKQEDILLRLLTDYTDRFYKALKTGYEGQFYDVAHIDEDHGRCSSCTSLRSRTATTIWSIRRSWKCRRSWWRTARSARPANGTHMAAISFDRHLYYLPLALEGKDAVPLKLRPLAFDAQSEWEFVHDLEGFYNSGEGKEAIGPRSLYLLRNANREENGPGFALADTSIRTFFCGWWTMRAASSG